MKLTRELLRKYGFNKPVAMHTERVGRGQYHVQSQFRYEITHNVDLEGDIPECSCENHTLSKNPQCKHIRWVLMLQEAELLPK